MIHKAFDKTMLANTTGLNDVGFLYYWRKNFICIKDANGFSWQSLESLFQTEVKKKIQLNLKN